VKASVLMTRPICSVARSASIADAAQLMSETGVGALTVVEDGELVGIVTDRDIAIRAVGSGLPIERPVSIIMTAEVLTCREETEIDAALESMVRHQVRRMPVCNAYGSVVGMLSLGDFALHDRGLAAIGGALVAICRPSAVHGQVARVF
jgi:CBS domain-containing protein